ncbi:MAG: sn-glycerol-3-phosphate ABC transporter ATP-binding protein UgpC [Bacillales bacterium]|nr:sn-glycerol-3-phosphate ABC transporter ATP-binding protein UgpC [Bacillales bacterium]
MATLSFKGLDKVYENGVQAVFGFTLEVKDKEFIVFVGPSGCGKSTTLRMVAGLEEITAGELYIDDVLVNDVPPKDRNIAMVFQSYALYPHMNVYDNMAFGLKLRKMPKDEIDRRVHNAADILGLTNYLDRRPRNLSGGQRQRVALGRAIVRDAKVSLMDEPLSNLDAKLRVQMRAELIKLHEQLGNTTIYVTHDQIEAMTMATRIVVMKDGRIQQVGAPKEIYDFPYNMFVGGFIGTPPMNFISGVVNKAGWFNTPTIKLQVPQEKLELLKKKGYIDKPIVLGIRPEDIKDSQEAVKANKDSSLKLKVEVSELLGSETNLHFVIDDQSLVAKIGARADLKMGDDIDLALIMDKCHFFDPDTELRIHEYSPDWVYKEPIPTLSEEDKAVEAKKNKKSKKQVKEEE